MRAEPVRSEASGVRYELLRPKLFGREAGTRSLQDMPGRTNIWARPYDGGNWERDRS